MLADPMTPLRPDTVRSCAYLAHVSGRLASPFKHSKGLADHWVVLQRALHRVHTSAVLFEPAQDCLGLLDFGRRRRIRFIDHRQLRRVNRSLPGESELAATCGRAPHRSQVFVLHRGENRTLVSAWHEPR